MSRTMRWPTALVTTAVVTLALAACGSSDDTSGSTAAAGSAAATTAAASAPATSAAAATTEAASTEAATTATDTAGASSAAAGSAVEQAKAAVAELTQRPTTLEVPPLGVAPVSGKTLDFIACATPTCKAFVPYLEDATAAVGWKLNVIQGGFAPTEIQSAWNQVLRDKPAGVIASGGIPTSLFSNQLAELDKLGIPVVLHDQPESDKIDGVTAVVLSDASNFQFGKELADLVFADAEGKDIHLGIFQTQQVPVFANERAALNAMIESPDCQNCTVDAVDFQVADQGTKLPSKVVSFLRSHPEVNYLYFDYNDAMDGVPAALQRAGIADQVKILINNISTTEAEYMRNGELWAAAANPWPEVLWKDFYVVLAKTSGAPIEPIVAMELPNMILQQDNLPEFTGGMFPLVEAYQDYFKTAWGV